MFLTVPPLVSISRRNRSVCTAMEFPEADGAGTLPTDGVSVLVAVLVLVVTLTSGTEVPATASGAGAGVSAGAVACWLWVSDAVVATEAGP